MIQALAKVFGIRLDARGAAGVLHEISGPLLGEAASKTLLGWLPGVGTWVNSSVAFGYTEALGWRVYDYFAHGNFSSSILNRRKKVFICYSHSDSKHVKRLLLHLRPVQELLQVFVDTSLTPGVAWRKEIEGALAEARVAVLFISPESRVQWETQVVCSSVLIALSGLTVLPSLDLPLPRSASTESSKDIYDYDAGHDRHPPPWCLLTRLRLFFSGVQYRILSMPGAPSGRCGHRAL